MQSMSTNTISSYRDMFTLMISFYETIIGIKPEKITLKDFTQHRIEKFLEWLEQQRGNAITTRNVRLAAIHAYAKYLARVHPDVMHEMLKIQSIPFKKCHKKTPEYISIEAMTLLLSLPDVCTKNGRRDATLLSIMYDSGCRVQELCDLTVLDIRLQKPATVRVTGKCNKTRIIPIMDSMAKLLKQYLNEFELMAPEKSRLPLFLNRSGKKLTRKGVTYILQKYFTQARKTEKTMKNISLANDLYALYRSQTTIILPFCVFSRVTFRLKYALGTSAPRPGAIWKYTTDSERLTHNHQRLPILPSTASKTFQLLSS